jgi:SAM-dependent methyltransferase
MLKRHAARYATRLVRSDEFICNVCGAKCARPAELGRETEDCAKCGSSLRLRGLIGVLSEEIFGVMIALPEFPELKSVRGIGMSDTPDVAALLAEKFDYTNTFYHQPPHFDVTRPEQGDRGRYDFILSSEVMEHVPPPVERAFAALCDMLKPDGLLLMTTPYTLGGQTAEHFPGLHEYTLASPGGEIVLVNRRADGTVETFGDLKFHGGHGSTLEMREFSQNSLRAAIIRGGFRSVRFAGESRVEFGIEHAETWSLPVAARKGEFRPSAADLTQQYLEAARLAKRTRRDLDALSAEYQRHIAFHEYSHAKVKKELEDRTHWLRKVESDFEDRSKWAVEVEQEKKDAVAAFEQARATLNEVEQALEESRAAMQGLESRRWVRLGRKLGWL